ncbi:hypothetical protein BaRGS_00014544 [Batillaria attramentaria]|uniref:Uncharacterized protein n=1 Tax=Batillaria attramentaria TaxID=370345 RepID=A0ABD0L5D1_9CAEN
MITKDICQETCAPYVKARLLESMPCHRTRRLEMHEIWRLSPLDMPSNAGRGSSSQPVEPGSQGAWR